MNARATQQPLEGQISRRRWLASAGAAVTLAAVHWGARAQAAAFPSGPVRFVVPFPAGTGTDLYARAVAKALSDATGKPVIVDNKPGANGVIGVQAVLQAPADGHTVLFGSSSTLSTNAALIRKLPYDPLKDLAPVSLVARAPCVIAVPPNSPHRTLADLLADARKRPGALNYGSASPGYTLYTEWLGELAGTKAANISFKGSSEVMAALAGSQIDFAVVDVTAALPLLKGGRLRALAYTDATRSPLLPDVPTTAEAGMPQFLAYTWTAAAVSAKTPQPLVQQLESLFRKAGDSRELQELTTRHAIKPLMTTGEELRRYQVDEIARWKRLAAAARLEQD